MHGGKTVSWQENSSECTNMLDKNHEVYLVASSK